LTRIPGEARQVLDFIIRKTYGWHKKEDTISLSQFSEGTGLSKVHVCRGIEILKKIEIITQKGNVTQKGKGLLLTYCFQKDFEKWKPLPKKVTLPKKVKVFTQKGNKPLPKKGTTKENNTKENNTKENKEIYKEKSGLVLDFLNEKLKEKTLMKISSKGFSKREEIETRLKEGHTVEECKQIIVNKLQDSYFLENPKYLNPVTLFRKSHFDAYLLEGDINTPKKEKNLCDMTEEEKQETYKKWAEEMEEREAEQKERNEKRAEETNKREQEKRNERGSSKKI
jgi:uncharacterized phage protein (TIGR02220 family)